MMFKESQQYIFRFIIDAEMLMWTYFRLNPFEMEKSMTVIDLNMYMHKVEEHFKLEQKLFNNNDFMKALYGIHEYLNLVFYNKKN